MRTKLLSLGYRFGSLVPFLGFDYGALSYEEKERSCWNDWDWDEDGGHTSRRCETRDDDGDISLYTLQIGARYLFSPWCRVQKFWRESSRNFGGSASPARSRRLALNGGLRPVGSQGTCRPWPLAGLAG